MIKVIKMKCAAKKDEKGTSSESCEALGDLELFLWDNIAKSGHLEFYLPGPLRYPAQFYVV